MQYDTIVDALCSRLPELAEKVRDEREWWGNEPAPPHVVFGDVLVPYVIRMVESHDGEDNLKIVFSFLEALAASEDPRLQEVVAFSVCERLGDEPQLLNRLRAFMGPATAQLCDETERFWGR